MKVKRLNGFLLITILNTLSELLEIIYYVVFIQVEPLGDDNDNISTQGSTQQVIQSLIHE